MNIEQLREYCIAKKGTSEGFPFDNDTLVFKVMGKMFAFTGLEREEFSVHLKCEPEYAIELREEYEDVQPGMNKKHWNEVFFDRGLETVLLLKLIDHSYDQVVKGLKKKDREFLNSL